MDKIKCGMWLQITGMIGLALVLIVVGTTRFAMQVEFVKAAWYAAFTFAGLSGIPLMGGIFLQCIGDADIQKK
jgi:hypothetical protein